jgi:hypothetical protein
MFRNWFQTNLVPFSKRLMISSPAIFSVSPQRQALMPNCQGHVARESGEGCAWHIQQQAQKAQAS